jgi:hypothetical protein
MQKTPAASTLVNHLRGAKSGWRRHTMECFDTSDSHLQSVRMTNGRLR